MHSLNCRGTLLNLNQARIMGILNLTPDSFSDGGKYHEEKAALERVEELVELGVEIIDVGGYSSRPFADPVSVNEELRRISSVCLRIRKEFPDLLISVDTFRSDVAKEVLDLGIHMINDISAGSMDPKMMETVSSYPGVPYIMMHMQGQPETMQENPVYEDVVVEIQNFFVGKIREAREAGIKDLVIDPGFGFGKSILHNYQLLYGLDKFEIFGLPMLCGISRKSMMYKFFDTHPEDVLAINTALHLKCLELGAQIIRVHDIPEAKRVVQLFTYLRDHGII